VGDFTVLGIKWYSCSAEEGSSWKAMRLRGGGGSSTIVAYQLLDVSVEDAVRLLLLVAELGPVLLLLLLLGLVVLVIDRVEYCLSHLHRNCDTAGTAESRAEVGSQRKGEVGRKHRM
jgi:hypothetical protein